MSIEACNFGHLAYFITANDFNRVIAFYLFIIIIFAYLSYYAAKIQKQLQKKPSCRWSCP